MEDDDGTPGAIAMDAENRGAAGELAKYKTPAEVTQMLRDDEALFMQWIKVRPLCMRVLSHGMTYNLYLSA